MSEIEFLVNSVMTTVSRSVCPSDAERRSEHLKDQEEEKGRGVRGRAQGRNR